MDIRRSTLQEMSAAAAKETPRRPRLGFLQFSLTTLIVLMTMSGAIAFGRPYWPEIVNLVRTLIEQPSEDHFGNGCGPCGMG
jgi:hypothetical protein